jgi:hypothetical protein
MEPEGVKDDAKVFLILLDLIDYTAKRSLQSRGL